MKNIFITILMLVATTALFARDIHVSLQPGTGNKSLHLYNGSIEIVEGGFEVNFFYTGTFQLTLTDENENVIYSGRIYAMANCPVFISADVSPEEDTVNELF